MGSVSGAAIVTRQHMVRPGIVSRILRGRHATWTCRNCMSQTESRWLEEVTRLSGAPSNRWRLYTGGRLQLLCSRTSLAPPSFGLLQRPAPPLERLRSRLVWYISSSSESWAVIEPHAWRWRPSQDRLGWLHPITSTHCSLSTVAGTD